MQLYSRLEGRGPTLVLNHGWTMSHRFFERQAPLQEDFRLLLWDLPGHGDSEKRDSGYQLADCSLALRELLEHYRIEAAVGVGWSMGSQVLWDYVARYGPAPFVQFVNVDAFPWGDPAHYQVPGVRKVFLHNRPRAARRFVRSMFFQEPPEDVLQGMADDSLRTPTPIALQYYAEIAACDYRAVFQGLAAPLLSTMGRHGHRPEQIPELRALNPRQDLVWFEHSGHMPFWEEAERFNRLLREKCRGP